MEVNDDDEDEDGGDEVPHVGQVGPQKRLADGLQLVGPRDEQVDEGDEGPFELRPPPGVDGRGREGLPDDGLADVGGDEEGDAGAQAVALLQQLVQDDDDHARGEQLQDDEDGVTRAQRVEVAVHARHHVGDGLAHGDQDAEQLLRAVEQGTVFLDALVDLNDARPRQQLHDEARRDDGRDAQLHQRAAVGRQDHTHPVERVGRLAGRDTVQRDLATHQENEQRHDGPQRLLTERNLAVRLGHLGQQAHDGPNQVQKSHGGNDVGASKLHSR